MPCSTKSPNACRWCALGAAIAVSPDLKVESQLYNLLVKAAKKIFDSSIVVINDYIGHEAVLQVYDEAIAIASQEWMATP